jgi:tRNA G10  N-methylase Trm11
MKLIPIHPFPARMAPEIVFKELKGLRSPKLILDPMSGSGTVLRASAELGHRGIGFDVDPLAVLMSRVWTTPFDVSRLRGTAEKLVREAKRVRGERLPWIDNCPETRNYIRFWFRPKQIRSLRRLSFVLAGKSGAIADALRVALSRIIITKERGASLARDTSHSRPHRVFFDNDYDVFAGFLDSVSRLSQRIRPETLRNSAIVMRGDARRLTELRAKSVDVIITSPPYLNAIDYFRGHRLSLVWLGYRISQLRKFRAGSIGTENGRAADISTTTIEKVLRRAGDIRKLPPREVGMVKRYAQDVLGFLRELMRVAKRGAKLLLVVGNSRLKNVSISNARINIAAAKMVGFKLVRQSERALRTSSRYLPPPCGASSGSLSRRMRTESLLSFSVAK